MTDTSLRPTFEAAAAIMGGRRFGMAPSASTAVGELLTDSRSLPASPATALFFALTTSAGDGHRFAREVYDKGVRHFVVEHPVDDLPADASQTVVADSLRALQQLAAWWRGRCSGVKVVGITGSRGKTVVKEWLAGLLRPEWPGLIRSPRSWNSQIGVPLSVWGIEPGCGLALVEAGVSRKGEMKALAEIIRPDVGVITCLTAEHAGGFGSQAEKLAEKRVLTAQAPLKIDASDIGETDCPDRACREVCRRVMAALGYDAGVIEERLQALPPAPDTRLEVIDAVGGCQMVDDRFTCDGSSLGEALEFMSRRLTPGHTLSAILGDIEGPQAEVDALLRRYGVKRTVRIGSGGDWPDADAFLASGLPASLHNEMILLKGQPLQHFDRIAERLERRRHETVLEVNLDALARNYNTFRAMLRPATGVVAMVKAFGYGAGSYELAKTLQERGAAYLAVAAHDEGVDLRREGITMPIMVLNPRVSDYAALFEYNLEPEVYSLPLLLDIVAEARRRGVESYPVHIKLDTGMHRLGFRREELAGVADVLLEHASVVKAASVFSHLCCADDPSEDAYTLGQLEYFKDCCDELDSRLGRHVCRHVLNTAGIVRFPEWQCDMVRLGIGLYGLATLPPELQPPLERVASLRTVVIALRTWPAGTSIGYNRRGRLTRESVIATVPVGYADGIDRHLGHGRLKVAVNGSLCPTVGSVCMDVMMIDVTGVEGVEVGTRVEIFGDAVPTEQVAGLLDTIPYEVQTSVASRVKRIYFRE